MYAVLCIAALAVAALALFPLRGGKGQHAHAGPGATTVQHLLVEEIEWPTVDQDDYVGRHRLRRTDMFAHRLEWALLEWAGGPLRRPEPPQGITIDVFYAWFSPGLPSSITNDAAVST